MGTLKIKLPEIAFRYKATAAYKPLYEMLHDWFIENGYQDLTDNKDSFMEPFYSHEESGSTYVMNIWWRFKKPSSNSRITYKINMEYLGVAVSDVEVQFKDKKIKAQKGELNIFINGTVELDYGKEWDKSWFMKLFLEFFKRRVWIKEMEMHKKILLDEVNKLYSIIKMYFELYQYTPEKQLFHEPKGYE
ncbi:MAG: hypothetical protein QXW00_02840 [Candidatus Woesearchaeota archaeon]